VLGDATLLQLLIVEGSEQQICLSKRSAFIKIFSGSGGVLPADREFIPLSFADPLAPPGILGPLSSRCLRLACSSAVAVELPCGPICSAANFLALSGSVEKVLQTFWPRRAHLDQAADGIWPCIGGSCFLARCHCLDLIRLHANAGPECPSQMTGFRTGFAIIIT